MYVFLLCLVSHMWNIKVSFGFREISKHFLSCSHNQGEKEVLSLTTTTISVTWNCLAMLLTLSAQGLKVTWFVTEENHKKCLLCGELPWWTSQQHTQGGLLEKPRNWGVDQEVSKRGRVSCYMSSIQFLEGEWGEQPCWNPTESEDFHCGRHHP